MLAALKSIFAPKPYQEEAHALYAALVAKARNPKFYSEMDVPDTLDGRFDMIILQLFFAIESLKKQQGKAADELIRALCEVFFADMDRSLREMGSSDTGVGKRIKKMSQAFFGRLQAYSDAAGDEKKMKDALRRNVYREKDVSEQSVTMLHQSFTR